MLNTDYPEICNQGRFYLLDERLLHTRMVELMGFEPTTS